MNPWLEYSIQYANQRSYLDDLFRVYPTIPDGIREINNNAWLDVEKAFNSQDNLALLKVLLKFDLFPIKDSYVAYFKRDPGSLERNPETINRLCGRLYEMGLEKIYDRCSEAKETNRQIGPLFRRWIKSKALGVEPIKAPEFLETKENAILDASDAELMQFSHDHLGYSHNKGLDLVAKFNGKYVIGEAKFLTDFGGHQNAQFNDAIATITSLNVQAIKVAILDGVLYIPGGNAMYRRATTEFKDHNIMSSLVLREFLYQI